MITWVKCHVFGLHGWTEWQYVKDGSCEQTRHCIRCGVSQVEIRSHQNIDWRYMNDGNCDQTSYCTRCGVTLGIRRAYHSGEFEQLGSYPCYLERICPRCGEKEEKEEHEMYWDERTHSLHGEEYVDQTYKCKWCGHVQDSRKWLPGWYEGRFPD